VVKFIDYSSKFGLGYILNTGAPGAFFNDQTKLVANSRVEQLVYLERKSGSREDTPHHYSASNFPDAHIKKLKLIRHFKSHLEEKVTETNHSITDESVPVGKYYVRKWYKTSHAVLLKFNVGVLQVVFNDKSEIIMNSDNKTVVYVAKNGAKTIHTEEEALESDNPELVKRMKYAKDSVEKFNPRKSTQAPYQENIEPLVGSVGLEKKVTSIASKSTNNLKAMIAEFRPGSSQLGKMGGTVTLSQAGEMMARRSSVERGLLAARSTSNLPRSYK
jgi:hypothetical protein